MGGQGHGSLRSGFFAFEAVVAGGFQVFVQFVYQQDPVGTTELRLKELQPDYS